MLRRLYNTNLLVLMWRANVIFWIQSKAEIFNFWRVEKWNTVRKNIRTRGKSEREGGVNGFVSVNIKQSFGKPFFRSVMVNLQICWRDEWYIVNGHDRFFSGVVSCVRGSWLVSSKDIVRKRRQDTCSRNTSSNRYSVRNKKRT